MKKTILVDSSIEDENQIIEMIKSELEYDTTFCFNVQEEVGLRGAKCTSFSVQSDVSLVLEATTAADLDGVSGCDRVCVLGNGPVISFMDGKAYQGEETFSGRFITAIKAMQKTDRVSAILHFGNPFPLEALPHIPRVIMGGQSEKSVETGVKVLAGEYHAKGVMTYDVKFK